MGRSILLVILACLLIVGALGVLDVIPLGLGGDADPATGDGPDDLLAAEGEDVTTLKGRGTKPGEAEPDQPLTMEQDSGVIPAEVRGTTRNGAVVRGRVVRAEGSIPLKGAVVELRRPDSTLSYLRAKANGRFDDLIAVTGADGRFAFLDVTPSDRYVVRARLDGYAWSSSDTLDLRGRETVDLGDLEMGPGGGLKGLVLDASKEPVVWAKVRVTWRISNPLGVVLSDPDTAPELEKGTKTDASGRFEIDGLEPGPKTLFVVAPDGSNDVRHSLTVEAGKTKDLGNIVLPGPGFIAGQVVWANGEPIPRARVFAKTFDSAATRTVDTGADGRFRIEWLPKRELYGLGVLVAGLPIRMFNGVKWGEEDFRVEFAMPGSLAGTVVRAKTGEPVERFFVHLEPAKPNPNGMLEFMQRQIRRGLGPTPFVGEGGTFRFERVAAGAYTVRVTSPGFPDGKATDVVVNANDETTIRIEVPDGNVGRGKVLRSAGAPISGARLFVIPKGVKAGASGVQLTGYVADREPDAATRGDGSFELPPQTPGRYDVIATHEDTLPGVTRGVDLRGGDASDIEIRLPPSGGVRGRLLDEHARPVKGGEQVYVLYPDGVVRLADVEVDGRFEVKGLPVGRCLVRWLSMRAAARYARVLGGKNVEEKEKAYDELRVDGDGEREIVDGGMVEVTLRLPRRVKVTGRLLTEEEGVPIQGAWLNMEGAPFWIQVEFDADGRYEKYLEPGKYKAWVQAGSAWQSLEIEIPDVPSYQLDLRAP